MSAMWIDRISVAVILLAASAYLARSVVRRVASAFGHGATNTGACGVECGCETDSTGDPRRAFRK